MRFQMESDFAKHVKDPELERVYLLHGTQPYLIANYEKLLVKKRWAGSSTTSTSTASRGTASICRRFTTRWSRCPSFRRGGA